MNIDTRRRALTAIGIILGVVLGAIVTAMKFKSQPLIFASEIKNLPAEPTKVTGLNKRKIVVNRNGATIWLRIESAPLCDLGEIDYIKADLDRLKESKLLLTVEPIFSSASTPPLYAIPVTLKQIRTGFDINFTFPYTEKAEHYGIYLCSDVDKKNSCHGKPLADYGALPTSIGSQDRVHFFSYFMIQEDAIEILNNSVSPGTQEELRTYLKTLQPPMPDSEIESVVATVASLSKQMQQRSAQIDVQDSRIKLILKRFANVAECANASRESIVGRFSTNQVIRTNKDGVSTDITDEAKKYLEKNPLKPVDESEGLEVPGVTEPVAEPAESAEPTSETP